MSFKDKVVIVTGGNAGIGATTAEEFAKEGAKVVIVGRNQENLNKVQKSCEDIGATVLSIKADITKDEEAKSVIDQTVDKFGKIDVLVNNAGLLKKVGILDADYMQAYDVTMNLNMRALALLTNLAAPYIVKTKGNIVNVSSIAGSYVGSTHYSTYKLSKAAVDHFTRCIALELAVHGVRVNAVSPGPVPTEIFGTAGVNSSIDDLKKGTALNKLAETKEVADIILFLASDKAASVTGSNYTVDNGKLLK
ncbi:3-oxoacyl-[acyl-carrier-protein] reductase FabG-like [Anticarsia gemmatalis]|uniref:3-oxoacyl-[acyl-carrier-protein] reductase FabG-like n=1 Tax=Anticarsia gemmatalis TaxID=129554 RepID=UPI003F777515